MPLLTLLRSAAGSGGYTPATWTFVRSNAAVISTASTAKTVTLPSAPAIGNLLIISVGLDKSSGTMTAPTGFAKLDEAVNASVSSAVFWRQADGTEGTSFTVNHVTSIAGGKIEIEEWSTGSTGTGSISVIGTGTTNSDGVTTVSSVSVTSSALTQADGLAYAFAAKDTQIVSETVNWTGTGTWTSRYSPAGDTQPGLWSATQALSGASGTTPSATATLAGTTSADQMNAGMVVFYRAGITSGPPKVDTLSDNFSTDLSNWPNQKTTGGTPSISGGILSLPVTPSSTSGNGYTNVSTTTTYDLTNSSMYVQMVSQLQSSAVASRETGLYFNHPTTPTTDSIGIFKAGDYTGLVCRVTTGGVDNDTYATTADPWLRLRHDGTNLLFETSVDGTTWTVRRTVASPPSWITAGKPAIQAGDYRSAAPLNAAYTQTFDNFNVPPVTATLTRRVVGPTGLISTATNAASSVRLKVGTDTGVTTGVQYTAAVSPDAQGNALHDTSTLTLTAGTTYYYRVELTPSSGASVFLDSASQVGSFKAAPSGQTSFGFSFGSCEDTAAPVTYDTIAALSDDLFVHLGDLWYDDGAAQTVASYRQHMGDKLSETKHQSVFSQRASTFTPSDHDSGMQDSGNGSTQPTGVASYNSVYREQMPVPTPTNGVYHTFAWGRIRFIVLDTRTFASDPGSIASTVGKVKLGSTQETWLQSTLTGMTEQVAVVVSADYWTGAATDYDDSWLGYNVERQRIATMMAGTGKNIVILTGDMHAVAADSGTNSPGGFTVFGAAPFDRAASQKGTWTNGPYPASGTTRVQQYGHIGVVDSGTTITLNYEGRSSDNTVRITQSKAFTISGGTTPKTGTDGAAISIADVASTFVTVSASDGAAVSVAEARTQAATLASTDTAAISVAETASNFVTQPVTDTTAISVAESRTQTATLSATDGAAVSVAETVSGSVTAVASDTTAITISEVSGLGGSISAAGSESTAVSVVEQASIFVTQPVSDTTAVSVSETTSFANTVITTDGAAVSVADVAGAITSTLSRTDTTAISIAESVSGLNTAVASDTTAISVSEVSGIASTSPGSETTSVSVTETANILVTVAVVDATAVSVAETAATLVTQSTTDTTAVSVAESVAQAVSVSRTDTTAVSVSESVSGSVTAVASDTASIAVSENASTGGNATAAGSDGASISVVEQATTFVTISSTDTAAVSVAETISFTNTQTASDNGAVSVAESAATAVSVSRTDTTAVSVAEAVSGAVTAVASDTTAISVSEITNFANTTPGSETTAVSVTESASILVTQSRTDTTAISIADVAATAVTPNGSTDTAAISVAESATTLVTLSVTDSAAISANEGGTGGGSKVGADNWANATPVTIAVDGGTFNADPTDNSTLTTESGEGNPASYAAGRTAWWKYTPATSGTISVNTLATAPSGAGGSTDSELGIWTGSSLATLTRVAFNSDSGAGNTSVITGFAVTAGTTYYIQVGAYSNFPMIYGLAVTGPASAAATGGSTINIFVSGTDTTAVSVAEAVSGSVTAVASDQASIAVNDIGNLGGNSTVPGNETTAISVTEQTSTSSIGATTDTTAISISDTASVLVTFGAFPNLISNPSFETNVAGFNTDAPHTRTQDSTLAAFGTKSARLTAVGAANGNQLRAITANYLQVTAGQPLSISAYYASPDGSVPTVNFSVYFYNDVNGTTYVPGDIYSSNLTTGPGFKRLAATGTVPAGATKCLIDFKNAAPVASGAYFLLDGVMANEGPLTPYADSTSQGNDTTAVSVAESRSIAVTTSASDTTAVSVSDVATTFVTLSASDTASISVNDIGNIGNSTNIGGDSAAVSVAETVTILVTQSRTDTTAVSVAESRTQAVTLSSTETTSVSVAETAVVNKNISTTDTTAITVSESATTFVTLSATDTVAISAGEVNNSFRNVSAFETAALIVSDMATANKVAGVSVYINGQWKTGAIMVYVDGAWIPAVIRVYRSGIWD